jgi:hypothetical protein
MDAAASTDPEVGLTAVVALRQLVEVLEELQVDRARQQGWSWRDIALRLGVTKQAAAGGNPDVVAGDRAGARRDR